MAVTRPLSGKEKSFPCSCWKSLFEKKPKAARKKIRAKDSFEKFFLCPLILFNK
jgi:hypothetical protein